MRLSALVLLAVLLLLPAPASAQARVACRAIDGDSLVCGRERVRIMGLDAPELRGRCRADAIAMRLGIEPTAMIRIRAGISYALSEAMDGPGATSWRRWTARWPRPVAEVP